MERSTENILAFTRYTDRLTENVLQDEDHFCVISTHVMRSLGYRDTDNMLTLPRLAQRQVRQILVAAINKLAEEATMTGYMPEGESLLDAMRQKCDEARKSLAGSSPFVQ